MNRSSSSTIIRHIDSGATCCDPDWEAAYERFETPDEEVKKFVARLKAFGFGDRPKDARLVELFCGRGGGLVALGQLGFTNLEGVDLSETLLKQFEGRATLHLADCRVLPFDNDVFDGVIVQGGLHHLPTLPDDLDATLAEVRRVLRPGGEFFAVEPWLTPFLSFVHTVVAMRMIRKVWSKGDALAEMIDHERQTYERWLDMPDALMSVFDKHFISVQRTTKWGKLSFVGKPR